MKRSASEMIRDILSVCLSPTTERTLMRDANLNTPTKNKYVMMLLEQRSLKQVPNTSPYGKKPMLLTTEEGERRLLTGEK